MIVQFFFDGAPASGNADEPARFVPDEATSGEGSGAVVRVGEFDDFPPKTVPSPLIIWLSHNFSSRFRSRTPRFNIVSIM